MGKLADPILFSTRFGINPLHLEALGVFDPCLTVDTRLYIDPLLLAASAQPEFSKSGSYSLDSYFCDVLILLQATRRENDRPWREAIRRMTFREIPETCLGYGDGITGSAIGPSMARRLVETAHEIVDLGVDRPELFLLLPVLEDDFGPDRISDMVTNIILQDICAFTERMAEELEVPTSRYNVGDHEFDLPVNDLVKGNRPVLLVPDDVLRHLPIVTDWDDIAGASWHNEVLRQKVSKMIGDIWSRQAREDKLKLRAATLSNKEAVDSLIDLLKASKADPYDVVNDPRGRLLAQKLRRNLQQDFPLSLKMPKKRTADSLYKVVYTIVEEFGKIIEKRGMWKALWHSTGHRGEKLVQYLFFIAAISWCKANDLDITPEADTGPGPVDFKFSRGYDFKTLVEVKLSDNQNLLPGYKKQLQIYKEAEETTRAIYLVIDVGKMGKKYENLLKLKNEMAARGDPVSEIFYIDGQKQEPPSKQK